MSADFHQLATNGRSGGIPTAQLLEMMEQAEQQSQIMKTDQKPSGNSTSRFNELCQKRNWTPDYHIFESKDKTGPQFKATVALQKVGVFDTGENLYPSKKTAKEAVAQVAYAKIKGITLESSKVVPVSKPVKEVEVKKVETSEDTMVYAAQLNTYMSMTKRDQPVYEYVRVGEQQFICRLTITGRAEPFESEECSSKRKAREQAAKEACTELGILDTDFSTAKSAGATTIGDESLEIWPKKVDDMCKELGIYPPTYHLTPSEVAPMFFKGAAFFSSTAPAALQSEDGIGSIPWIPSEKGAKTAICINVFQELEEFQAKQIKAMSTAV